MRIMLKFHPGHAGWVRGAGRGAGQGARSAFAVATPRENTSRRRGAER